MPETPPPSPCRAGVSGQRAGVSGQRARPKLPPLAGEQFSASGRCRKQCIRPGLGGQWALVSPPRNLRAGDRGAQRWKGRGEVTRTCSWRGPRAEPGRGWGGWGLRPRLGAWEPAARGRAGRGRRGCSEPHLVPSSGARGQGCPDVEGGPCPRAPPSPAPSLPAPAPSRGIWAPAPLLCSQRLLDALAGRTCWPGGHPQVSGRVGNGVSAAEWENELASPPQASEGFPEPGVRVEGMDRRILGEQPRLRGLHPEPTVKGVRGVGGSLWGCSRRKMLRQVGVGREGGLRKGGGQGRRGAPAAPPPPTSAAWIDVDAPITAAPWPPNPSSFSFRWRHRSSPEGTAAAGADIRSAKGPFLPRPARTRAESTSASGTYGLWPTRPPRLAHVVSPWEGSPAPALARRAAQTALRA